MTKPAVERSLMGSKLGVLLALSCLTAAPAWSQVPLSGIATRDCVTAAFLDPAMPLPFLYGFHWQTPDRDPQAPDVLFDERFYAPHDGDGPQVGASMARCWGVSPIWRQRQVGPSIFDIVILGEGEIWLDSCNFQNPMDIFTLESPQAIGALGGDSPEVTSVGDRHRIRWTPLIEHDAERLTSDCHVAGSAPRGFVRGYVVWSLPVSAFATPTPQDFLRFGHRTLVDLSSLDFNVADPDGSGGSDRDPDDGLLLINPDGAPDSGDEILDLEVCPEGGLARWYAVQPIVTGRFDYYDGGRSSFDSTSALVDVNADGVPDVADILADGMHEFSDACDVGLGLLWQGGIATSTSPGLGAELGSPPACGAIADCSRGSRNPSVPSARLVYEPSALDLRIVDPLTVRPAPGTTMLVVGWEETLGDEDALYVGHLETLWSGRRYDHEPVVPCLSPGPPATIARPPYDAYFLVTRWEDGVESSYGRDSHGRERPPALNPCR